MSNSSTGDAVFEEMGSAAATMCYFGSCFIGATELAIDIPRGVGGPCAISDASTHWREGASAIQEIQQSLQEILSGLSADDWTGDDRSGFDKEVSNLLAELGDSHNTAEAIGITLEVLRAPVAVWPTMALTMGIGISTIAACFYAETASIVGDLGASEATYAMGEAFTGECLGVMAAATGILASLLGIAQAVIAGAVYSDISTQRDHGNTQILGDLGQAEVDGIGEVADNAAQLGISYALDKGGEKTGGEQQEGTGSLGGVLGGLGRAEGHNSRALAHGIAGQGDVGQHQGFEYTHPGASLQQRINDMAGWAGPSVEIESDDHSRSDEEGPGDGG